MSYDGSGGYAPPAPHYPAIPGTKIAAEDFNTIIQDIADALSRALIRDGQAKVEGNIDVNGFKLLRAKLDETSVGKTLPPGTDTDQLATMKALKEASFNANLPSQAGNAGKLVSTDGFSAFWTNLLQGVTLAAVKGTAVVESIADAYTINPAAGNLFNLTLTGNTSLSFAAQPVGEVFSAKVILRQDETGGRTATWPENISWLYTAPSLNPTPWGVDTFELLTTDGGITWLGAHTSPGSLLRNYGDQAVGGVKDFFDKANFRDGLTTASLNGGPLAGMRNLIINGDCRVSQYGPKNIAITGNARVYGGCDRIAWAGGGWTSISAGSLTQLASSSTFANGAYVQAVTGFTGTATGTASMMFDQRIEAINTKMLRGGPCTAQATLYHNAAVPLTASIHLYKPTAPDNYTSTTLVASSPSITLQPNTKTLLSHTFTPSSADYDNGLMVIVTYSGIPSVTGRDFYVSGFQLEPGSVATPFERVDYSETLRRCQRYYQSYIASSLSTRSGIRIYSYAPSAGVQVLSAFLLPVQMRAAPVGAVVGTWTLVNTTVAPQFGALSATGFEFYTTSTAAGMIDCYQGGAGVGVTLSAEL